jgi:IK cytokine
MLQSITVCSKVISPHLWDYLPNLEFSQSYKSSKEMMPKAAYQFGVKMADGRKGHRQLGGKAVEQKEQKQLKKIQGIFSEKHGKKYSKAFVDDPEPAGEIDFVPAPAKKRRI